MRHVNLLSRRTPARRLAGFDGSQLLSYRAGLMNDRPGDEYRYVFRQPLYNLNDVNSFG